MRTHEQDLRTAGRVFLGIGAAMMIAVLGNWTEVLAVTGGSLPEILGAVGSTLVVIICLLSARTYYQRANLRADIDKQAKLLLDTPPHD